MIELFPVLLFSNSDCVLILCCIYLHILIASTRRVHHFTTNLTIFLHYCPPTKLWSNFIQNLLISLALKSPSLLYTPFSITLKITAFSQLVYISFAKYSEEASKVLYSALILRRLMSYIYIWSTHS